MRIKLPAQAKSRFFARTSAQVFLFIVASLVITGSIYAAQGSSANQGGFFSNLKKGFDNMFGTVTPTATPKPVKTVAPSVSPKVQKPTATPVPLPTATPVVSPKKVASPVPAVLGDTPNTNNNVTTDANGNVTLKGRVTALVGSFQKLAKTFVDDVIYFGKTTAYYINSLGNARLNKVEVAGDLDVKGRIHDSGNRSVEIADPLELSGRVISNPTGDISVDDSIEVTGNTSLFGGVKANTIEPLSATQYDLGSTTKEWSRLYVNAATLSGNTTIGGNLNVNGNTTLGDATSDTTTLTARIASNIVPTTANTYDLGASALQWRTGYFGTSVVVGATTTYADGSITTSAATTTYSIGGANVATLNLGGTGVTALNIGTTNSAAETIAIGTSAVGNTINIGTNNTVADTIAIGSALDSLALTEADWSITTAGLITTANDVAVNGGDITTTATNFNLLNATATNINFGGGATSLTIGATTGRAVIRNATTGLIGNVGIGTSNPLNRLDVSGAVAIGSLPTTVLPQSNMLTVSGNVGIGTTNPQAPLNVTTSSTAGIRVDTSGSTNASPQVYLTDPSRTVTSLITSTNPTASLNGMYIGTTSPHPLMFGAGGTQVLHVTTTGNVGIGTTVPATALDVTGAGTFSGDVAVNGGDLTTTSATATIFNGTATTVSLGNAAVLGLNVGVGNTAYAGINIGTGTGGNAINVGTNNTVADTIAIGSALDSVTVRGATVTIGNAADTTVSIADDNWSVTSGGAATFASLDVNGNVANVGGDITFDTGAARTIKVATSTTGAGNNITIQAGDALAASAANGGNLVLQPGAKDGIGTRGAVVPSGNGTDNLGAAGTRWSSIFANTVDFITSLVGSTGGATPTVDFSTVTAANFNLQANSIVDADVVDALTISGGTINNSTIGATTASSGLFTSLGGADNQAALNLNIGVTGADAGAHTIALQIDGNTGLSVAATGDGAGGVGVRTIQVGVSGSADVVTIGDANADVSLTDAQWSVGANGAITSSPAADVVSLTITPSVAQAIAIDASATNIATALSVGANDIVGTTGLINYDNFDVAATGNITVQPAYGLDTNAGGALAIGNTNATSVSICNSAACDTVDISDNADTNTIHIGGVDNSGTDTVSIATEGTAADIIAIGNANAATTLAVTGGTAWNVTTTGVATFATAKAGTQVYTKSDQLALAAGFTLTPTTTYTRVAGNGGAQTSDGTTAVADGTTDGQLLILVGTSDANTVTITDTANVQLAASANKTLGAGDTLTLIWDSGASSWQQVSFSDN